MRGKSAKRIAPFPYFFAKKKKARFKNSFFNKVAKNREKPLIMYKFIRYNLDNFCRY